MVIGFYHGGDQYSFWANSHKIKVYIKKQIVKLDTTLSCRKEISMKLRELQIKDAPLMLKWMHNESAVRNLKTDFSSKTIEDCEYFIENSKIKAKNLHMAIVDNFDNYVGTVSLKNINKEIRTAEFSIVVIPDVMGEGFSSYAMKKIIEIGFEKINLNCIYWCVSKNNKRAIKFYDKGGYLRVSNIPAYFTESYSKEEINEYYWYMVENTNL